MKIDLKHLPHYFSLITILVAGILGFYFYSYDKIFQFGVGTALSFAYVSWGVVHHMFHNDLTVAVFFEYLTVSILGLIMVASLIFWI